MKEIVPRPDESYFSHAAGSLCRRLTLSDLLRVMRSPHVLTPPSLRRCLGVLVGLLVSLLIVGCGGGSLYSANVGEVADRFLPTERTVSHHPDSLRALTITEGEEKMQYQVERDYQSLIRKWSSRFQNLGPEDSPRSRTYATFWSLELSLVSLQSEMGVLSLRKEKARELINERRKEYSETIQIDVYWFVGRGRDGIIAGPGASTQLHVRDSLYRPVQTDYGPLREAFVAGGNTVLYRRNSLYFPRMVEGTDILENASGVKLEVSQIGEGSTKEFAWEWTDNQTAHLLERSPRADGRVRLAPVASRFFEMTLRR